MRELNLIKYIEKIQIQQKKIKLNEYTKNILNKLRIELKDKYNEVLYYNDIKTEILENKIVKGTLFNFIPKEIKEIIEINSLKTNTIIYEWKILSKYSNYNIKFHINYSNKQNNYIKYIMKNKLKEYYIIVRTIIDFLINHKETKLKNNNINIYLYLTKHIKLVPNKKSDVLGYINVNTGLTTFCNEKTEINIFRAEEWFKVLIHECIHNLCMDFSSLNKIEYHNILKKIFIIDSEYLLFETYTELWAEIIQILFLSIITKNNDINNDIEKRITNEFIFSVIQSNKTISLCTQNKATYNDLINKNKEVLKLYKEESNCFAYYILKMIGLYNINNFILWCVEHNGNNIIEFNKSKEDNILNFIYFFKKYYNEDELIKYINTLNTIINKKKGTFINETLRISIFELII